MFFAFWFAFRKHSTCRSYTLSLIRSRSALPARFGGGCGRRLHKVRPIRIAQRQAVSATVIGQPGYFMEAPDWFMVLSRLTVVIRAALVAPLASARWHPAIVACAFSAFAVSCNHLTLAFYRSVRGCRLSGCHALKSPGVQWPLPIQTGLNAAT